MAHNNSCIITIGREYGSGGRIIGKKLSEKLNIPFYDRELIRMIAVESGIAEELIKQVEQLRESSLIYDAYDVNCQVPFAERIHTAQKKIITNIADKGSCVIVGRCADYLLKDNKNCLKVFIYAPFEDRVKRVAEEYCPKVKNIKNHIKRLDKDRAAYYDYFTTDKWGDKNHYHIVLNSSIGIDLCVNIIEAAYKSWNINA